MAMDRPCYVLSEIAEIGLSGKDNRAIEIMAVLDRSPASTPTLYLAIGIMRSAQRCNECARIKSNLVF